MMSQVAERPRPAGPRAMLESIHASSRLESSIRARTEGLTWALWGLVFAAYGLSTGFAVAVDGAVLGITWGLAPLALVLLGIVLSVGLWRSVALQIRPDISRARGILFFVSWWALFALAQRVVRLFAPPGAEHVVALAAFSVLLFVFGMLNPLRYTPLGRATALGLGFVALLGALFGATLTLDLAFTTVYVAAIVGVSWPVAGAYALYRG